MNNKKKRTASLGRVLFFVGLPGLEPGKAGPESAVLPLHHSPIVCVSARGLQPNACLRFKRLGYPDSNQERQDQNLQCYHYTIAQFAVVFLKRGANLHTFFDVANDYEKKI